MSAVQQKQTLQEPTQATGKSFADLGLSFPLLNAIKAKGYDTPSPIQEKAIPTILKGKDVMGAAQTGTGKTASFVLPLLERLENKPRPKHNHCYVLVLTPTRELAHQVFDSAREYGEHSRAQTAVVYGGVKINPQMMRLRKGADILVATPGRLLDLYENNAISFDQLETLVLDEADRMLDMGFIRDIKKIMALMPEKKQSLLFSATFSPDIRELAKGICHNPSEIDVAPRNTAAETVDQIVYTVDKKRKGDLLVHLIKRESWQQAIVFCRTKHGANKLATRLGKDRIRATAIHGNKSQAQRMAALKDFKKGKVRVLVATDIAARGLDIPQLPYAVNFDLPNVSEDYVHRIGRTGRAGMTGKAVSLVCADEIENLQGIERLINKNIERHEEEGFEADHQVPASIPVSQMKPKRKPKKPKKPSQDKKQGKQQGNQQSFENKSGSRKKPAGKNNKANAGNKGPKARGQGQGGGKKPGAKTSAKSASTSSKKSAGKKKPGAKPVSTDGTGSAKFGGKRGGVSDGSGPLKRRVAR